MTTDEVIEPPSDSKRILPLMDMDVLYRQSPNAICVNEIPDNVTNFMEYVNEHLLYAMDGQIEFSATCQCGELTGNYNQGAKCAKCGTIVGSEFLNLAAHKNWIGIPRELPPVIHPTVFLVLRNFLGKVNRTPLLELILDPARELPLALTPIIPEQGFRYFHDHYDEIMDYFLHVYPKTSKEVKKDATIEDFLLHFRDITFCTKLPILDPALHPISKHAAGKVKIDPLVKPVQESIVTLTYSMYELRRSITSKRYESKTLWKVYSSYIQYCSDIISEKIGSKRGFLRKQLFGMRIHFSCRAVITPNNSSLLADEVRLPWKLACNLFKPYVLNHLVNRYGYSWSAAIKRFREALVNYDALIKSILDQVFLEYPTACEDEVGFKFVFGRNPSLEHGCELLMRIVGVKVDLSDETIEFPPPVCPPPNADYDGDALWGTIIIESSLADALMKVIHPMELMLDKNFMRVGDLISLTVSSIVCINVFFDKAEDYYTEQEKLHGSYDFPPETVLDI